MRRVYLVREAILLLTMMLFCNAAGAAGGGWVSRPTVATGTPTALVHTATYAPGESFLERFLAVFGSIFTGGQRRPGDIKTNSQGGLEAEAFVIGPKGGSAVFTEGFVRLQWTSAEKPIRVVLRRRELIGTIWQDVEKRTYSAEQIQEAPQDPEADLAPRYYVDAALDLPEASEQLWSWDLVFAGRASVTSWFHQQPIVDQRTVRAQAVAPFEEERQKAAFLAGMENWYAGPDIDVDDLRREREFAAYLLADAQDSASPSYTFSKFIADDPFTVAALSGLQGGDAAKFDDYLDSLTTRLSGMIETGQPTLADSGVDWDKVPCSAELRMALSTLTPTTDPQGHQRAEIASLLVRSALEESYKPFVLPQHFTIPPPLPGEAEDPLPKIREALYYLFAGYPYEAQRVLEVLHQNPRFREIVPLTKLWRKTRNYDIAHFTPTLSQLPAQAVVIRATQFNKSQQKLGSLNKLAARADDLRNWLKLRIPGANIRDIPHEKCTEAEISATFRDWVGKGFGPSGGSLFVYLGGHGVVEHVPPNQPIPAAPDRGERRRVLDRVIENWRFVTAGGGVNPDLTVSNGISIQKLMGWLRPHWGKLRQLVLVVDTCYSGAVAEEFARSFNSELRNHRPDVAVICASSPFDSVPDGAFLRLLMDEMKARSVTRFPRAVSAEEIYILLGRRLYTKTYIWSSSQFGGLETLEDAERARGQVPIIDLKTPPLDPGVSWRQSAKPEPDALMSARRTSHRPAQLAALMESSEPAAPDRELEAWNRELARGGYRRLLETLRQAHETYSRTGDQVGALRSLHLLGMAWEELGDILRARRCFEEVAGTSISDSRVAFWAAWSQSRLGLAAATEGSQFDSGGPVQRPSSEVGTANELPLREGKVASQSGTRFPVRGKPVLNTAARLLQLAPEPWRGWCRLEIAAAYRALNDPGGAVREYNAVAQNPLYGAVVRTRALRARSAINLILVSDPQSGLALSASDALRLQIRQELGEASRLAGEGSAWGEAYQSLVMQAALLPAEASRGDSLRQAIRALDRHLTTLELPKEASPPRFMRVFRPGIVAYIRALGAAGKEEGFLAAERFHQLCSFGAAGDNPVWRSRAETPEAEASLLDPLKRWVLEKGTPLVSYLTEEKGIHLWLLRATSEGEVTLDYDFRAIPSEELASGIEQLRGGIGLQPGLGNLEGTTLFTTSEGTLWLGTEGGGIFFQRTGVPGWTPWLPHQDALRDRIYSFAQQADRRLWIGTADGVLHSDPARTNIEYRFDTPRPVRALLCVGDTVWMGREDGLFSTAVNEPDWKAELPGISVNALCAGEDGTVWVGTSRGLRRLWRGPDGWTDHPFPHPIMLPYQRVDVLYADPQGIWCGTKDGLALLNLNGDLLKEWTKKSRELPDDNISALGGDGQRTVWVGTHRGPAAIRRLPSGQWEVRTSSGRSKPDDCRVQALTSSSAATGFLMEGKVFRSLPGLVTVEWSAQPAPSGKLREVIAQPATKLGMLLFPAHLFPPDAWKAEIATAPSLTLVPDDVLQPLPFSILRPEQDYLGRLRALTETLSVSRLLARSEPAEPAVVRLSRPNLDKVPERWRKQVPAANPTRLSRHLSEFRIPDEWLKRLDRERKSELELSRLIKPLEDRQASEGVLARRPTASIMIIQAPVAAVDGEVGIVLAPDPMAPGSDGVLTTAEIASLTLRTDLILLSGSYDTSQSDYDGLVAALHGAGARAIISTIQPVADRLFTEFTLTYLNLSKQYPELTKAELLRRTRGLLTQRFPQMDGVWARFRLTGDGSARPLMPQKG